MTIREWDLNALEDLASVYNGLVEDAPHCPPVEPLEFAEGVRHRRALGNHAMDLRGDRVWAAEEGGRIVGFVHAALGQIDLHGRAKAGGFVHFLGCEPGRRGAAQGLLDAAEGYLKASGAARLWAFQKFGGYRFYHLEFGNLSDRMPHILALLRLNGYTPDDGEFFMVWPEFEVCVPPLPDPAAVVEVVETPGAGALPGVKVSASIGGRPVGLCDAGSAGGGCRAAQVQETFFVHWLGVEAGDQARGWGRYLLLRTHAELRRIGYRNAVISTDWQNWRALAFYTNYGYRLTDKVYGFAEASPG